MSKMPSINILGDVLSDLHYKKHVDEELIKSAHAALNELTELVEKDSIHGKWIRSNPKCSICGAVLETDTKPNYCPTCGRKMDND